MHFEDLFEKQVRSSWIYDLTYDPDEQVTIMTTFNGNEYWFPMDEWQYKEWLRARSKGKYYHRKLK